MPNSSEFQRLSKKLQALDARVEQLSDQVARLRAILEKLPEKPRQASPPEASLKIDSEEVLEWVEKSSLLERVSTVGFLLVIALILRTVTDAGVVGHQLGAALGIGYAGFLILFGGFLYFRHKMTRAPVFAISGAALMFMIVIETHARFQAVPAIVAHGMLILTGLAMTLTSRFHGASLPIAVGALGMGLSSLLLDVKNPTFPYLGLSLLAGNAFAWCSVHVHRNSWLRWLLFFFLILALFIWGVTLGSTLFKTEQAPLAPSFGVEWFLPALAATVILFTVTSLLGVLAAASPARARLRRFDLLVPFFSVSSCYLLANYFLGALRVDRAWLGWTGVGFAVLHAAIGQLLARRVPSEAAGPLAFVLSSSALIALALPVATEKALLGVAVLPLWGIAIAMGPLAWRNPSAKIISNVFQAAIAAALGWILLGRIHPQADWSAALAAGAIGALSLYQYFSARRQAPNPKGLERSRALTLLAGMAGLFFLAHEGALAVFQGGDLISGIQSVLINTGAVALMLFAVAHQDREIRNVSVLITLLAAAKLLLMDLLGLKGIPLVLSVLSFAVATLIESIALAKWKRDQK